MFRFVLMLLFENNDTLFFFFLNRDLFFHKLQILKLQGSYLEGIGKQIGGLTQKVKSWYWGRPLVSLDCLLNV